MPKAAQLITRPKEGGNLGPLAPWSALVLLGVLLGLCHQGDIRCEVRFQSMCFEVTPFLFPDVFGDVIMATPDRNES